jgi:hypothetical protein
MRQLFQARRLCVKSIGKCSNLWNYVGNDGWDAPYEMHLLNHA